MSCFQTAMKGSRGQRPYSPRSVQLKGRRKSPSVEGSLFYFIVFWFQPVKDADPHFHHFLLSQTEKVSDPVTLLTLVEGLACHESVHYWSHLNWSES